MPLKDSALPYLPLLVHVAPKIVPLLPLPDRSFRVAPDPSLNEYAATKPPVVVVGVTVIIVVTLAPAEVAVTMAF